MFGNGAEFGYGGICFKHMDCFGREGNWWVLEWKCGSYTNDGGGISYEA